MTQNKDTFIVEKNRQRAFWALVIVGFMALVSAVLAFTGLIAKPDILWTLVTLGTVGLLGFGTCAVLLVRIMRSSWHLALTPAQLALHTPTYILTVPWENVAGIAVAEVNWRMGCVLVFENVAAVAEGTKFLYRSNRPDVITNADSMLVRMQDNYKNLGYHLGIPGRILEKGPEELAELLVKARTGKLWQEEAQP